jgi:hypothetical protein
MATARDPIFWFERIPTGTTGWSAVADDSKKWRWSGPSDPNDPKGTDD